jgi:ribose 5-phosphate isomerase B
MKIAIGCDHAGFELKIHLINIIQEHGYTLIDLGAYTPEPSDYPDFAVKMGEVISSGEVDRGVLICGSGVGVCIAANKIKGIYAGICHDTYSAHQGVEHDHMNVLCLGAHIIGMDLANEIVVAFLSANYQGEEPGNERHARRVEKIKEIENGKKLEW